MNKQEIYDYIKSKNIWFEITEHKAVFNMDELSEIEIPYPEYDAKNLFVRDDNKRNYYLITIKGNKRVDLNPNKCIENKLLQTIIASILILLLKKESTLSAKLINIKLINIDINSLILPPFLLYMKKGIISIFFTFTTYSIPL